jgi:quercetin dioxygenase-like cupin family protein
MSLAYLSTPSGQQSLGWIGGSVHRVVLDTASTEGRLAAFRSSMRAGAAGPVHVHDREDETVFLLEGEGTVWSGDQRWTVRSGDTVFLPRQVPHTYLFTSETVEMITVCTPAGMEEFFRAAGWDLSTPPPPGWQVEPAALRAAAQACGQRVLGPPLGADDVMPSAYLSA